MDDMEKDPEPTPQPKEERALRRGGLAAWRWPLVAVLAMVLVFLGVRGVWQALRSLPGTTLEQAADIAERFRSGTITTTFTAALPRLLPEEGTKLELVAFEAVETFSRSDDRRIFYGMVPLGTNVTEIRVPVIYRYHVRLDDPWHLEVRDQEVVVHAPRIHPTLPPAIDTAGLEKRSERGWLRFDVDEQMADLEHTLTERLSRRAADPDTIDLVRETCRVRLAEFVRTWLLAEDHWRADRFRAITVLFADEGEPPPEEILPTLVLDTD
jgi:hypothetical protein